MLWTALLFAVTQGVTEFLPVSSSGHLQLLALLPGAPQDGFLLVSLHAATNLAGLVYFRRRYWDAARGIRRPGPGRRFAVHYMIALAATGAIALPETLLLSRTVLYDWWASPWFVGGMMLANAGILLAAPRNQPAASGNTLPETTWQRSALVGLAQGVATVPGLSRSGITIAAGLGAGMNRTDAVNFSFLLAGPLMLAALAVWTAAFWGTTSVWFASWQSAAYLLAANLAAFLIALGAIRWLLAWVRAGRLRWFAPWSAALGLTALLVAFLQN